MSVLVVSAIPEDFIRKYCGPIQGYIRKPFTNGEIVQAVHSILDRAAVGA